MRNLILTIGATVLAVGCTTGTAPYVLLPDDEMDRALAQFPVESETERRAIQTPYVLLPDDEMDRALAQFPVESETERRAIYPGMSDADWAKFHDTAPAD